MRPINTPTRIYIALGALRSCLESAEAISAGLPEEIPAAHLFMFQRSSPISEAAAAALGEASRSAIQMVNNFGRFSDLVHQEVAAACSPE